MDRIAAVGSSVVIKGELLALRTSSSPGASKAPISVEGHLVVVEPGGQVAADVVAKGVVIAGTVHGSVVAEERIELRSTARVEGELGAAHRYRRGCDPQRSCRNCFAFSGTGQDARSRGWSGSGTKSGSRGSRVP